MIGFCVTSKLFSHSHQFLTYPNWQGLLAPKTILPPEMLLHPVWQNHAQVRAKNEIKGETAVRRLARRMIAEFEDSEKLDKDRAREFTVRMKTSQSMLVFKTTRDWRGLRAPRRILTPDRLEKIKGNVRQDHITIFGTDEIQGETNVREAARNMVVEWECAHRAPRSDRTNRLGLVLGWEHENHLEEIRGFLAFMGEGDSKTQAARWALKVAAKRIPPVSE
jgi:hypothetical protein